MKERAVLMVIYMQVDFCPGGVTHVDLCGLAVIERKFSAIEP